MPESQHQLDLRTINDRQNFEDTLRLERLDTTVYPTGPCPVGHVVTCCLMCGSIITVPPRTERPLCTRHEREYAHQNQQAADDLDRRDAERWDGLS